MADRSSHTAAAVVFLVALTALGALVGGLTAASEARYTAGATVLLTGDSPTEENLYVVGRYVLDRAKTCARTAESDVVADAAAARLGDPAGSLRGTIQATAKTAAAYLDIVVEAPDPVQAVRRAEAVAGAAADAVTQQENPQDIGGPRVTASVISVDSSVRDERFLAMRLDGVLGATVGLLAGWLVLALRRGGRSDHRHQQPADQDAELRRADRIAHVEVVRALMLGRSTRGVVIALAGLAGIVGYAVTGSPIPPLLVLIAAGVAGRKDLRYAAGGIMYAAATAFPAKVNIVDLGLLTPTLLEVAIAIGVGLLLARRQWDRLSGPFTVPVLALLGALAVGVIVGKINGATVSDLFASARLMATVVSFFVIREAFRGRPYQLLAVAISMTAVVGAVEVLAVPLHLEPLLSSGGSGSDHVVIGAATVELARLDPPVLQLMSVVLVIVAAGVVALRPVWLWALVLTSWLLLEALSFTRAAWGSLIALAVVVAVLRGGARALIARAVAVLVIGLAAFGILQTGLLGDEGAVVAARVSTIVTGEALESESLADRLRENAAAEKTLTDSPFVGTGLALPYGAELVGFDATLGVNTVTPRMHIHNQYLRIWLWMGVIGLLAYGWLGIRVAAFAVHDRMRRGRASTLVVASGLAVAGLAVQQLLAPDLDNPATIVSIVLALAVMELSGAPTQADGIAETGNPGRDPRRRTQEAKEPPMEALTHA